MMDYFLRIASDILDDSLFLLYAYIKSSNHGTGRNLPSESNFYMATSYRCSKSALNQLIKCFSLDIPEVCIFVFLIYEKKFFL